MRSSTSSRASDTSYAHPAPHGCVLVQSHLTCRESRAGKPGSTTSASSERRSRCSRSNVRPTFECRTARHSVPVCAPRRALPAHAGRLSPDYSKLPPVPTVDQVFLLDPLIATGGTACAAIYMIMEWGIPGEPNARSPRADWLPLTGKGRSEQDQASRRACVTARAKPSAG